MLHLHLTHAKLVTAYRPHPERHQHCCMKRHRHTMLQKRGSHHLSMLVTSKEKAPLIACRPSGTLL